MKCNNCGMELRPNARFCDICGEPVEAERTMLADDSFGDEAPRGRYEELGDYEKTLRDRNEREDEYEPLRNRGFKDETPYCRQSRYADEYDRPRRYAGDDEPRGRRSVEGRARGHYADDGRNDRGIRRTRDERTRDERTRSGSHRYKESSGNGKKKALVISIVALLLVLAIVSGVIFFVNLNTVSAAELEEAKEKYLPPSQAVSIDTSQDDPSTDNIKFTYDSRARIISCSYKANEKTYDQSYAYDDSQRKIDIETSYRNRPIYTKEIGYDRVISPGKFEDIDGYYVRLDEESVGAPAPTEAPAATVTEPQPPTEAPTEVEMKDEDISEYPELDAFFSTYICWGPDEYDSRHALDINRNILRSVVDNYTCIDPNKYPGNGKTTYHSDEAKQIWPWDTKNFDVCAFDKTEADWICKNIFNITDSETEALYNEQYNEQYMYSDGVYYYTIFGGKGSVLSTKLSSIKTDGRFYYVVYDIYAANIKQDSSAFAVMELKNIDGANYWSMYYNTSEIPDEITPFDPEGR